MTTPSLVPNKPQLAPLTEAQLFKNSLENSYDVLVKLFEYSFNLLNHSKNPQANLDSYGKNAHLIFDASQKTIALLQLSNPAYVPPTTTYTYAMNADGSVTVVMPVVPPTDPIQTP